MPVTILVAEDSTTMRRVLEMTFAGEDAKVTVVSSGEEAVAKAEEIKPDVVIADLSMHAMDGYGVAQKIRGKPALAKTSVIAMASQKNPYNETKGKVSGVQDFVIKPFDTQALIDKVKKAVSSPRRVGAPEPPPSRMEVPPARTARQPHKTATLSYSAISAQAKAKLGTFSAAGPGPSATAAKPAPRPIPEARPLSDDRSPAVEARLAAAAAPKSAAEPAAAAASGNLAGRLSAMGLSREQVEGVLALTGEVVEKVVWEVVPDLAETIIREEIKRLTS